MSDGRSLFSKADVLNGRPQIRLRCKLSAAAQLLSVSDGRSAYIAAVQNCIALHCVNWTAGIDKVQRTC